jgi:hypothetical protein
MTSRSLPSCAYLSLPQRLLFPLPTPGNGRALPLPPEHALAAQEAGTQPAAALALLVRRTALAAFPREQVAALAGPAWLAFLDRTYDGQEFSQGAGRMLETAAYGPVRADSAELGRLIDLVRRWITQP